MLNLVKSLSRKQKRAIVLGVDLILIPLALLFTFGVQAGPMTPAETLVHLQPILPYLVVFGAGVSLILGIPDIRVSAYEIRAVIRTAAFAVYLSAGFAFFAWLFGPAVRAGTVIDFGIAFFLFSAASRVVMYRLLLAIYRRDRPRVRVMVYGAGTTGMQLVNALRSHESIEPVAFVDDNAALEGLMIAGLPVHTPVHIARLAHEMKVGRVLLAIPSLSQPKRIRIARMLEEKGLEVQSLPSFAQLIGEEPLVDQLKRPEASRFLQRPQICAELNETCTGYRGRVVLISGAGGSIGSELARQILVCRPEKLVLFELSELALYEIDRELRSLPDGPGTEIVPILGSVTDPRQVRQVIESHGVDVVLHAAAYKHVPLVEINPLAGLANNVLGTHTLARASVDAGVERFLLVSSDKAVRPAGVMGASKRLAELVVQDLATRHPATAMGIVRFGNVLGSSGSVVPLFQDQVRRGGPVTVTDPNMTRYFMTIGEAVHLVLQAGTMAERGDVFVLDMGAPVSVLQLARQVIESAGYSVRDTANPDGDIEIRITGLRPGEKLQEELTAADGQHPTANPKILRASERHLSELETAAVLRAIRQAVSAGDGAAAADIAARWIEPDARPMPVAGS